MTSFWIIAGIFIVTALLFVLPTLLRSREVQDEIGIDNDDANIGIYRDQLIELDSDFKNDILSQEQHEKSKQELQQRLLQDVPQKNTMTNLTTGRKGRSIATSFILVLTIPLSAVLLYLNIGDTRGLLPQAQLANATQMQQASAAEEGPMGHPEFSSVVDGLVARLNDNPDDVEGWIMLARTYTIMEDFNKASDTYAKLIEIEPNSAQILSDYADTLAMANQGGLSGKPAKLIEKALRIDPEYPKALALAGTVEFEQKRFGQAANYWERLLAVIPAESELAKSVSQSIDEAKTLAKNGGIESAPEQEIAKAESNDTQKTVVSKDTDDSDTASSAGVTGTSISGTVTLGQAYTSKVSPNDTLFIYARAKTGPKMPLAILRLTVGDLPAEFSLNDDMAMTPTMKISSFPEVVVEARISKSGQAVPASGDFQGFSKPAKLGNTDISIVIDQLVP